MKILILTNNSMGLYKFRKELLSELVAQENEIYVSVPEDEFTEKIQNLKVNVIDSPIDRRGTNPFKDLLLLKNYIQLIKKIKPDVVLTYTIKPNIFGGMACRVTKTPYLTNITGLGTAIENKGLLQKFVLFLYKLGLKKSKTIFFQNNYNLKFLKEKLNLSNKLILLPGSGVNLIEYIPLPYPEETKPINFLFIGRVMKDKGIEEIIYAASQLDQHTAHIHIVGGCDEDYEDLLNELTRNNVLTYHGQQADVKPFIEKANAIILPSYHEGTANVLLEGAACARPLIASDIPGCREIIKHNVSGFVFPPKDKEAFLSVVEKFIKLSPETQSVFGKMSRQLVENEFDRKIVINKYLEEICHLGGERIGVIPKN
ncbi:hypothetical protein CF394_13960 [Tetzosporium hominis]|uniref:Glycosyltransferase family 1 protein n=1 Tax=Tetzosporium hominis TaxID=2020506 RepID=A0A264W057_9BACL|nr:glycosyltransferase family 4 protein [Tetzosporium hominis]OZS76951.1 hypothetical protein CF394_13960 [Tetzosporium hominis]